MKNIRSNTRPSRSAPRLDITQKILVIEDQRSIAQLLAAMIKERWNIEAVITDSLGKTKELVDTHPETYLIAICDLHLPDAPYGEILDYLHGVGIKTIALSGAYGDELRETILNKGAIDFIPKENINSYEYVTEFVGRICKNSKIKVLAVDDSMSARAVLKHSLEQLCFHVLTAKDGRDALSVLKKNPDTQLLLVDYNMPEMDGFQLSIEVRKKYGKDQICIIGISSSDDAGISARFLKCGANDFIRRPYSYEEFVCRINQNIEMLSLIRANQDAAYRDSLTGLFNRRYFFQSGEKIHAEGKTGKHLVLAMIDIDHFKRINDECGHPCGDQALKHLAALLGKHFPNDLLARLGGEEFAVLMSSAPLDDARARLKLFQEAVRGTPLNDDGNVIQMTVSIGLTSNTGKDIDEMLKLADTNLYQAKQTGRDKTVG